MVKTLLKRVILKKLNNLYDVKLTSQIISMGNFMTNNHAKCAKVSRSAVSIRQFGYVMIFICPRQALRFTAVSGYVQGSHLTTF